MKYPATLLLSALLLSPVTQATETVAKVSLKQTMKQMRLHYKEALDATDAATFNTSVAAMQQQLEIARQYDFSPERKQTSLEGLNKVAQKLESLEADNSNLADQQQQLSTVDNLRKEYHKKTKPGVFELVMNAIKESLGFK